MDGRRMDLPTIFMGKETIQKGYKMSTTQPTGDPTCFSQQMTTDNSNNITWVGGQPQTTGTQINIPQINFPTPQNGPPTTVTVSGTGISFASDRKMFCDRRKHRMYRAIGEICPCFTPFTPWNAPPNGEEGFFVHEGVQYYINAKGLASRVYKLFERLEIQEELIDELKAEITRLKEDNNDNS